MSDKKLLDILKHALGVIEQCGIEKHDGGRIRIRLEAAIKYIQGGK